MKRKRIFLCKPQPSPRNCGLSVLSALAAFLVVASASATDPEQDERLPVETVALETTSQADAIVPLSPEATQFVKGMALMLLPETYTDDDDWGGQKRLQSGLNVDLDGLKVNTSRRWKNVNHGVWRRIDATLVEPQEHFQLAISILPRAENGDPRYRVQAKIRLRANVRQQRWNLGVKLYSINADVIADISFNADLQFRTQVVKTDDGSKFRVLPHIETASARLDGFSLRNISHVKGGAVREFGKMVEALINRSITRKGEKLPTKINKKIQKKPERFEIPAGILVVFGESPKAE